MIDKMYKIIVAYVFKHCQVDYSELIQFVPKIVCARFALHKMSTESSN